MLLEDIDTLIALAYNKRNKQKELVDYSSKSIIKRYYRSMVDRVKRGSYKKKGIKVELSFDEFYSFWMSNLDLIKRIQSSGYVVSVDRIDSFGNYSINNIRFLPLHLNTALGRLEMTLAELKKLYSILDDLKNWV